MTLRIDGSTRLVPIVGDPIAQVRSPAGLSEAFSAAGRNMLVVPAHVAPADLEVWFRGQAVARNVDGIVVTIPHKFAAFRLCRTVSPRARLLEAVNALRRDPDGSWHGDMFDGLAFVTAARAAGCRFEGARVLLVGAGGAGSAIAEAVAAERPRVLAIHDADPHRRDRLMDRLAPLGVALAAGSPDPRGFDAVLNATPLGMCPSDPLPVDPDGLDPAAFVGCVVTEPEVPPLLAAARARGCRTATGVDMFLAVRGLIVDFLLGAGGRFR
ncbi:shikimate dehydrogenase family protein [Prosthecomicrobium sp. N25]|uniref:shikimate dehydrogenase family protein n=1 Tax=Prosthecomicrobium sp. N25 TaxID=3129254 RepID=UPI00307843F3